MDLALNFTFSGHFWCFKVVCDCDPWNWRWYGSQFYILLIFTLKEMY